MPLVMSLNVRPLTDIVPCTRIFPDISCSLHALRYHHPIRRGSHIMSKSVKYRGKPGTVVPLFRSHIPPEIPVKMLFKMSLLQETKDQVKNISSSGISHPQTYLVFQFMLWSRVTLPTHFTTGELHVCRSKINDFSRYSCTKILNDKNYYLGIFA